MCLCFVCPYRSCSKYFLCDILTNLARCSLYVGRNAFRSSCKVPAYFFFSFTKNWTALTNFSVTFQYKILRKFVEHLQKKKIDRQAQIKYKRVFTYLFPKRQRP